MIRIWKATAMGIAASVTLIGSPVSDATPVVYRFEGTVGAAPSALLNTVFTQEAPFILDISIDDAAPGAQIGPEGRVLYFSIQSMRLSVALPVPLSYQLTWDPAGLGTNQLHIWDGSPHVEEGQYADLVEVRLQTPDTHGGAVFVEAEALARAFGNPGLTSSTALGVPLGTVALNPDPGTFHTFRMDLYDNPTGQGFGDEGWGFVSSVSLVPVAVSESGGPELWAVAILVGLAMRFRARRSGKEAP